MPQRPNLLEIAKIVSNSQLLVVHETTLPIQNLLLDSRQKGMIAAHALFFAIVGQTHDGHHFLLEAYQKGVRNFVVSRRDVVQDLPADVNLLLVPDTVVALQELAAWHRRRFKLPVIGITGSNGKTIVKEWLHQLLWHKFYTLRSPKSYNSQVGVPLSVWPLEGEHTLGIFEAGISQPHEMEALATVIQPTIGIMTNIGSAHDKGFENRLQKCIEKVRLFERCQTLIFRADYPEIEQAIIHLRSENSKRFLFKKITWQMGGAAGLNNKDIAVTAQKDPQKTLIKFAYQNQEVTCYIPFTDEAAIENAVHCLLAALVLGIKPEYLALQTPLLTYVAMRLEQKEGINNCTIINDAYSNDFHSLAIALDFMLQQQQHNKRTIILSDMLQTGQPKNFLYRQVANLLKQKNIQRLIAIGPQLAALQSYFADDLEAVFFDTTAQFLLAPPTFANETILVKGARIFEFERIVDFLAQKNHSTILEINLNAIAHNIKIYKKLLNKGTKLMAMVKAFSYGSGTFEIANLLQHHKIDYLAVAYTDEGVALRKAGIHLPIVILNPLPETFGHLLTHNLEPEIYSLSHLQKFVQYLQVIQTNSAFPYPIHLKLDTGMHRLGFAHADLPQLCEILTQTKTIIHVVSIFSHLAASDEATQDDFTYQQFEQFRAMYAQIEAVLPHKPLRHLLNSAGIVRHPALQMEMVRLGVGMYGFDGTALLNGELQHVSTLKTYICQIKKLDPNDTIGYGRHGKLVQAGRIATVGIGYADGLNRHLSTGKGYMFIKGQVAPIIGKVCMDMTMLDISHIDGIEEGDEVIVFGQELPIQAIAELLNTIPYEVLTSVAGRVKRVYFQE